MNILVIFTGGTIGSAASDKYIGLNESQGNALLQMYADYETDSVHFDCVSPYTILSENLNGKYMHMLADCIRNTNETEKQYDGIIVTHGTDTLQYTASGLYYAFRDYHLPIVLVSSNYILEDARANGFANFAAAVSFIRLRLGNGVYVAYQNNSTEGELSPVYIHHGNRLLPYTVYSDTLYSIDDAYFCQILPRMEGEHVHYDTYALHEQHTRHDAYGHEKEAGMSQTERKPEIQAAYPSSLPENSGILMLYAAPAMYYPEPDSGMKAILLITYHSGTLPTDDSSFCEFVRKAHTMEIPIYVLGMPAAECPDTPSGSRELPYESTARYEELHLTLLPVMSPADAYMWLYRFYAR